MTLSLTRRLLLGGIGVLALTLVAGGVVLAQTMNLAACPLCILQRLIYLLLTVEAILIVALGSPRAGAGLMAATAAFGAYWAGYQTWLQRFATDVSCVAEQPWWEQLVNWAGRQWPMLFEATGLCSEAGWKFLGLSIAEWSLFVFTAMTLAAFFSLRRPAR
jgi:disulfide bond formation protein DsbB